MELCLSCSWRLSLANGYSVQDLTMSRLPAWCLTKDRSNTSEDLRRLPRMSNSTFQCSSSFLRASSHSSDIQEPLNIPTVMHMFWTSASPNCYANCLTSPNNLWPPEAADTIWSKGSFHQCYSDDSVPPTWLCLSSFALCFLTPDERIGLPPGQSECFRPDHLMLPKEPSKSTLDQFS